MAKTPKTVNDFLTDLRHQLTPGGAKEVAHLKGIKKEDLKSRGLEDENDGNYYLWDSRFYDRIMVEKEFSIEEQKIAEYFPLQSTIEGMLSIFEHLFGLVFVEIGDEERAKLSRTCLAYFIELMLMDPQQLVKARISFGTKMSRSLAYGMMKVKAVASLAISIWTSTPALANTATQRISLSNLASCTRTGLDDTPLQHLSAIFPSQQRTNLPC